MLPEHPQPKPQGTPRPNIANLLRVAKQFKLKDGGDLSKFEFVLVDESGPDPSRNELVWMIGMAYKEFESLVRELDEARAAAVGGYRTAKEMFEAIMGREPTEGENMVETARDRALYGRQCYDVINSIVHNVPADRAKEIAASFLTRRPANILSGNIVPLVNENNGNESGTPPPASAS